MGFELLPKVTKNGTDYHIVEVYPTISIQLKAATIVADDELRWMRIAIRSQD
jgi:hypothetical protein